jgi:hypothetical protein
MLPFVAGMTDAHHHIQLFLPRRWGHEFPSSLPWTRLESRSSQSQLPTQFGMAGCAAPCPAPVWDGGFCELIAWVGLEPALPISVPQVTRITGINQGCPFPAHLVIFTAIFSYEWDQRNFPIFRNDLCFFLSTVFIMSFKQNYWEFLAKY